MLARNKKEHLLNGIPMVMASENEKLILETISLLDKIYTVKIVATAKNIGEIKIYKDMYKAEIVLLDNNLLNDEPDSAISDITAAGLKVIMVADATPKAFQCCLRYMSQGAADLLLKSQISQAFKHHRHRTELVNRLAGVAKLDELKPAGNSFYRKKTQPFSEPQILFCEDCGARNIFSAPSDNGAFFCQQCGDLLENHLITPYRRASHVTVFVAGVGSFRNLINIIPRIDDRFRGTIIAVVSGPIGHVDSLSRYLNSISQLPVKRISNGSEIEGGSCYIAASDENFIMKPFSTSSRMERAKPAPPNGPFDIMMRSVSEAFKQKSAVLFLSGDAEEGEHGLGFMKKNGGKSAILSFNHCINSRTGENALRKYEIDKIVGEDDVPQFLKELLNPLSGETVPIPP